MLNLNSMYFKIFTFNKLMTNYVQSHINCKNIMIMLVLIPQQNLRTADTPQIKPLVDTDSVQCKHRT